MDEYEPEGGTVGPPGAQVESRRETAAGCMLSPEDTDGALGAITGEPGI